MEITEGGVAEAEVVQLVKTSWSNETGKKSTNLSPVTTTESHKPAKNSKEECFDLNWIVKIL